MEIKLAENSILTVKDHNGNALCSIDEATGATTGIGKKLYLHHIGVYITDNNNVQLDVYFSIITDSSAMATTFITNNYAVLDFHTEHIMWSGIGGFYFVTAITSHSDILSLKMIPWGSGKYGFNLDGINALSNTLNDDSWKNLDILTLISGGDTTTPEAW